MIDFINNKILKRRKTILWVFFSCFALVLLTGVNVVNAQGAGTIAGGTLGAAVASLIGVITSIISYIVGNILVLLVGILANVAKFNDIITVDAVRVGWVIVRDLVNMFFVLILLVIAFATILRIESYNAKKTLPKLLIMAVLINFSKTIFGVIIDFSQVIMLTFVSGFGGVAAANLINLFNVQNYQSIGVLGVAESEDINNLSVAGAFIAGMLAMIITTIVVLVMLGVLIMRVVMLWIYTILSPLVFLGFAFPPLQKYVGKIWEDFIKQVMVGPILAFFIWLALLTASSSSEALGGFGSGTGLDGQTCAGINAFFCENQLQTYIITIGLLIGGLMVTQQIGGAAGSMAGKGMSAIQNGRALAWKGTKDLTTTAGRKLDTLQMKGQKKIFGKGHFPKSLNYMQIKKGWDASRDAAREKYERGDEFGVPPSTPWRDVVDRVVNPSQYMAIKKSKKKQDADRLKADRIDSERASIQARVTNTKLEPDERAERRREYMENSKDIQEEYVKMAPLDLKTDDQKKEWAQKQLDDDIRSVGVSGGFNADEARKTAKEKQDEAENLRDIRKTIPFIGMKAGSLAAAKTSNMDYEYSRKGAEEDIDKNVGVARRETGDESGAIVEYIMKAFDKNESSKVVAGFRLLAQNNDTNEGLKDKRMINLMTKNNGILEKLVKNGAIKGLKSDDKAGVEAIKDSFRNNPVSEANAQAMIQGVFKEVGLGDKMAAKYAAGIGEIGVQKGNTLTYAMGKADTVTGGHTFDEMTYKDGKLHASEERTEAGVGKMNTFEAQAWARQLHPNSLFAETANGDAAYLTDGGAEQLRSLTKQKLAQLNRLRSDNFKAGKSPKVMRQMRELAQKIQKDGDKEQADLIRYFAGYIKSRAEGGGGDLKEQKDLIEKGKEA